MSERFTRSSGVLLHVTSLPGPYGIGDLGPEAYAWVEQLVQARQTWWQMLPLGPTGAGNSPYQSFCSFAGNPNLVSPEMLLREGLLHPDNVTGFDFPADRVDYGAVAPFKKAVLRRAWENFRDGHATHLRDAYDTFRFEKREWLDDYALFTAIKEARMGEAWQNWPTEFMRRDQTSAVLEFARQEMADEIQSHQFTQFLFFRQWAALRRFANSKGVRLIGDIPIFVSPDSSDVWGNPKLFQLDGALRPKVVAGVPPDYFSPTGQLWGNPVYDWDAHRETGFAWWVARLRCTLELVDVIRLDHFRGFAAGWQVRAGETTAMHGEWSPGPGADLFTKLRAELGDLPLIAEDLGEITPDVYALRDNFKLPGMKVLQFAFDDPRNAFLPHNYNTSCVAYTGTHDNDTTKGWFSTLPEYQNILLNRYVKTSEDTVAGDLVTMAWGSVAEIAITPLQDLLNLGSEARMNIPGIATGNWEWRVRNGAFTGEMIASLRAKTELYHRAAN
ncbi:4-alpha-glucanotransferase [Zavarzinella formosa]|uniref:4-alpha-glucanotransferase n=1 Tax=Zavarzinella formosa TaxID=360055 RepID=UPI0002EB400E|nr:4-alpha-glucanotransferase [Zavarzinella formosa]